MTRASTVPQRQQSRSIRTAAGPPILRGLPAFFLLLGVCLPAPVRAADFDRGVRA